MSVNKQIIITFPNPVLRVLLFIRYTWVVWVLKKDIRIFTGIGQTQNGVPYLCMCMPFWGRDYLIMHSMSDLMQMKGLAQRIEQIVYVYEQKTSIGYLGDVNGPGSDPDVP